MCVCVVLETNTHDSSIVTFTIHKGTDNLHISRSIRPREMQGYLLKCRVTSERGAGRLETKSE